MVARLDLVLVHAAVKLQRDKREFTERNQRIVSMRRDGMTLREIGALFDISEVRVRMICKRAEDRLLEPRHTLNAT